MRNPETPSPRPRRLVCRSGYPLLAAALLLLAAAPPDSTQVANEPWDVTSGSSSAVKDVGGTRIFSFEDDVVITHGPLVATSDAARYIEAASRALLQGNVVMTQDSTIARGPSAIYERIERLARFPEGVVVERPTGTAVGGQGLWNRDSGIFTLTGGASAADTAASVDATTMDYDTNRDLFRARGNAKLVDEASGVLVTGGLLEYDRRAGLAFATESPIAEFSEEGEETPIRVAGDFLTYDPRTDVAIATRNVRIERDRVEAFADSATFLRADERAVLTGSPRLVDGLTEVSGDRLELFDEAPGRRRILVEGSARVSNRFAKDRARPEGESEPLDGSAAPVTPGPPDSSAFADSGAVPDSAAALDSAAPSDSAAARDLRPAWLKVPSDKLPAENLLFGDRMVLVFENDALARVEVAGHARSKFYPSEEEGRLDEWNDVAGDTLNVWFTESELDSVVVLGDGVGEYRLGPEEGGASVSGATAQQLLDLGRLVRYRAPRIRYDRSAEIMHLDQGAEVEYKTMILRSGVVDFDARKEVMDASGDPAPVLIDRKDKITGTDMRYHLASEKGEIVAGRTQFENGWYSGKDVWRLPGNVLAVETASFTTCDLETPHYHFSSKRMKIYPNDKIVAKPVVLRIRNIPVLALPYYFASLRKERHSGFLFPNLELGVDDSRGRFLRKLGYYWVPNDYTDLTTSFDFYPERERFVGYLNGRYNLRYRYSGNFAVKYERDVPNNRREQAFELDHRQSFGESADLTASGTFLSSSSLYRDIDDQRRLDRDIRSHATFTKSFRGSNQSLRAEVERRENLDTGEINERLPVVQYALPSRSLGGKSTGLYYGVDALAVHVRDKLESGVEMERTGSRVGANVQGTANLGRVLRLAPQISSEGVYIDEDKLGDDHAVRGTFSTNVNATSTFYGMFLKPIGPTRGFRHVVEPQVSWAWAPDFDRYFFTDSTGVRQDRFFSFAGIGGTPGKTNRGSLSLRNLLQTKFLRNGQEKRYDFLSLRNTISYDFLAEETNQKPLSTLISSLNVFSSSPVNQTWSVAHDPYDWDLLNSSVTTQMRVNSGMFRRSQSPGVANPVDPSFTTPPADFATPAADTSSAVSATARAASGTSGEWTLDLSHSFQRGAGGGDFSSRLVLGTTWSPTRKWRVNFSTQYDLKNGDNTTQQWSVHRTLHCWELSFDRRLLGGDWTYYIRVNVTDLPDIQAQRGDRSSQSSVFGGLGGLGGF